MAGIEKDQVKSPSGIMRYHHYKAGAVADVEFKIIEALTNDS
ncbi:hypothetical protein [Adhaeribacter aquaticus]|nr:hypothetical protein [Adhaeribacter aquaticus]